MAGKNKKQGFATVFSLDETAAAQSALDKVFPEQSVEQAALQVVQGVDRTSMLVPVANIVPNPFQPRKRFDQAKLQELADSIKEEGVLQPIVVRRSPTKQDILEIAAGERRWRAAMLAGLENISCEILEECSDARMRRIALLENLLREQLTPLELAESYRAILDERDEHNQPVNSVRSLAEMLKQTRDHVDSHLALLRVPDDVRKLIVEDETILLRVIRELGNIEDPIDRAVLVEEVRKRTLNQADIVAILQELKKGKRRQQKEGSPAETGAPESQVEARNPEPQAEAEARQMVPLTHVTRTVLVKKLNKDREAVQKTFQRIAGDLETLDLEGRQLVRTHLETMAQDLQELIEQCS
jgi:ParB family transcriptional regulator, chromosome partitioning protein